MQIVSVTALVQNFADACRALVPMLDGAAVPWGDSDQYDNWDRIAEPLFETLVTEPCAYAAVGEANLHRLRIGRYGFRPIPGDCNAFIALDGGKPRRMVRLSTSDRPFDIVEVVGAEDERLRLAHCNFVFVFEEPQGTQRHLAEVDLDAQ